MKHEGLSKNRLHPDAGNEREIVFSKAWNAENKMCGTLEHLIPDCTERDAQVAATIVQWLGSPVGSVFLGQVIASSENIQYSLGVKPNV